jgi:hypothetical protein
VVKARGVLGCYYKTQIVTTEKLKGQQVAWNSWDLLVHLCNLKGRKGAVHAASLYRSLLSYLGCRIMYWSVCSCKFPIKCVDIDIQSTMMKVDATKVP